MSNLSNTKKIQSNEGGTLSATKNLVSFDVVNDGGVIDLSASYVSVSMSVATDAGKLHNAFVRYEGQNNAVFELMDASALVKNASMSCNNKGVIESLKRVDTYRDLIKQYSEDLDTTQDSSHLQMMATRDKFNKNLSPFRVLSVDETGEERSHDVRINLKDVYGIAQSKAYSTSVYGRTKLQMELNIDKLSAAFSLGATDSIWNMNTKQYSKMNEIVAPAAGQSPAQFTTDHDYNEETWKAECPFWVGQEVLIDATNDGTPAPQKTQTITAIGFNDGNGELFITLDGAPFVIAANKTLSLITIIGKDPADTTLSVHSAELVVKYVDEPNPPQSTEFITVETEQDNAGDVISHNKNYVVSGDCVNLVVALQGGSAHHTTVSALAVDDYRMSVNNENLTNANVKIASPQHYDRISRYMMNHGKPVGNLQQRKIRPSVTKAGNIDTEAPILCRGILEPLPITNDNKIIGLEINSAAKVNQIILYKEVIKSV